MITDNVLLLYYITIVVVQYLLSLAQCITVSLIVIYTYLFDISTDIESNATGIHSVYREIFAPFALLVYEQI